MARQLLQAHDVYKTIPRTVQDFAPVTLIGTSPLVLVVHPSLPVRTTRELIALAKSKRCSRRRRRRVR